MAIVFAALPGCAVPSGQGELTGKVNIGPLTPVERPGVTPTVPPEVYQARKIMVYDSAGKTLVRRVDIGNDGTYRVTLRSGTYKVDINHAGIDRSAEVPALVTIKDGQTTTLDINIDTGIR